MTSSALAHLGRRLKHKFRDKTLLQQALTHRSFGATNNERLEFLGDSILNFCIAENLFRQFESAPEGDLSRVRAALVKGETLAVIGRELALGECLRLGEGEAKSGGAQRDSILADAVEAIIGAVYLDGGMEAAQHEIYNWYRERLEQVNLDTTGKDPKTRLQEMMQALTKPLPRYTVVETSGEAHARRFTVTCTVPVSPTPTTASGSSRRAAEKAAAAKMLALLDNGA